MALFPAIAMAQETNDIFHPTFGRNNLRWFTTVSSKNAYVQELSRVAREEATSKNKEVSLTKDLFIAIYRNPNTNGSTTMKTMAIVAQNRIDSEIYTKGDDQSTTPYNYLIDFYVGTNIRSASFQIDRFDPTSYNISTLYRHSYAEDIFKPNTPAGSRLKGIWLEYDQDFPSSIQEIIIRGY
jgi:hypothetical protein